MSDSTIDDVWEELHAWRAEHYGMQPQTVRLSPQEWNSIRTHVDESLAVQVWSDDTFFFGLKVEIVAAENIVKYGRFIV